MSDRNGDQNQKWSVLPFDVNATSLRWVCVRTGNPELRCTVMHSTEHSADNHCAALNRELYEREIDAQETAERGVRFGTCRTECEDCDGSKFCNKPTGHTGPCAP